MRARQQFKSNLKTNKKSKTLSTSVNETQTYTRTHSSPNENTITQTKNHHKIDLLQHSIKRDQINIKTTTKNKKGYDMALNRCKC